MRVGVPAGVQTLVPVITALYCLVNWQVYLFSAGHAVAKLVEALCYKPEGRGFHSR
jgi:hypothetical protein